MPQPVQMLDSATQDSPRILIVDDDSTIREVLSVLLVEEGYSCVAVSDAMTALETLSQGFELVICDLKMPDQDGIWLLNRIREQEPYLAVIMLTGFGDTKSAVECLRRGASDYILKPPKITDLVKSIERALAKRRIDISQHRHQQELEKTVEAKTQALLEALSNIEASYNTTLLALVAALDAREHETCDHSLRVVRYCDAIARRLNLPTDELLKIRRGALLHDIGKIGVPDAILLKPGPLNQTEWIEMKEHPEIGFNILKKIEFLQGPSQIVLSHHERFDGCGYPNGLSGKEIPLGARIFTIADTLDAITSNRPYRTARKFQAAREEIQRCSGSQFDPEIVEIFLTISEDEFLDCRGSASNQSSFAV